MTDVSESTVNSNYLRELAEHRELTELVSRYGLMADEKRFDDARSLLTDDVVATYPFGTLEGIDLVSSAGKRHLGGFERTQHVFSDVLVELDGERARVRANLIAAHIHTAAKPAGHFDVGAHYRFGAVRTPDGWRFNRVALTVLWTSGADATNLIAEPTTTAHATVPTTPTQIMEELHQQLRAEPSRTEGVNATFAWVVSGETGGSWWVEASDGTGAVHQGTTENAVLTVHVTDEVFVQLGTGELEGADAFFNGLLRLEGDQSKAIFLGQLMGNA